MKYANQLKATGVPKPCNFRDLVTKRDLKEALGELRTELKEDIAELRTEFKDGQGELDSRLSRVEAELGMLKGTSQFHPWPFME